MIKNNNKDKLISFYKNFMLPRLYKKKDTLNTNSNGGELNIKNLKVLEYTFEGNNTDLRGVMEKTKFYNNESFTVKAGFFAEIAQQAILGKVSTLFE